MAIPGGPFTLDKIYEECERRKEEIDQVTELYLPEDESNSVFFFVEWKWRVDCSHRWITIYQRDQAGWWYKFALMDNTGSTSTIEKHLRDVYIDSSTVVREAGTSSSSSSTVEIPGSKRDPARPVLRRIGGIRPFPLQLQENL